MNIEQFKKSLFIEMMLKSPRVVLENRGMLLERHGILNDMDIYIKRFKRFLNQNRDLQGETFILEDNIFSTISDCFFNEVKFEINWHKGNFCDGACATNLELDDNDKIKCLDIRFNLGGTTWASLVNSAGGILAHEITHAYEAYQRLVKGGKTFYDEIVDTHYTDVINLKNSSTEQIEKLIGYVNYYLFNFEVNAYIASVYSNLLNIAPSWKKPEDALEYLEKKDKTFQNYVRLGDCIYALACGDAVADKIEEAWIKSGKAPLPFKKIITKLFSVYHKRLQRLRRTIAKLIYDVYQYTRQIRTDDIHDEQ